MIKPEAVIIEDDLDQSYIFSEALKLAGFEVELFQDGEEGLSRLLTGTRPDLIILDLHLPTISGKEILTKIQTKADLIDVPVVLATANPMLADTLKDRATLTLLKPISFAQLRDLAKRLAPPS